jgi:Subtilase family
MANQDALRELLRLWNAFREHPDERFAHGFGKWRSLFRQLKTIRLWDVEDRLRETGLMAAWTEDLEHGETRVRFEAELWFRQNAEVRGRALTELRDFVEEQGGEIVAEATIPEIAYHAVIGQIPAEAAGTIIRQNEAVRLLSCEQVMFFRPVGQSSEPLPADEPGAALPPPRQVPGPDSPLVALLDGLPIENHSLLAGRLIVDDPDNWAADYPSSERNHGTAMASLIAHGDLAAAEIPLNSRIYVRPVMRPDERDWRDPRVEAIPTDVIPSDLVHRVVRRMYEPEGNANPVAASVRVISMSIGDTARPYDRVVSPFARIIDWLSWRYRTLFIVSAGNHSGEIQLDVTPEQFAAMQQDDIARSVFRSLGVTAHLRRLLSPAESINALTIGALHEDANVQVVQAPRIDPYVGQRLPSPVNAVGLGFRRSVKPDLLVEGGRQLYTRRPGNAGEAVSLSPERHTGPPGQRVASPGPPADVTRTRHLRGTSNAAAVGTRRAAQLLQMIDSLEPRIDTMLQSVASKCLLVHGSSWNGIAEFLEPAVEELYPGANIREQLSRFTGYGAADVTRVLACTDSRVTIIGVGDIGNGEGHVYSVPLPPTLSGKVGKRRLTITVAWFSPLNPLHRNYRMAAVWFEVPEAGGQQLSRMQCDYRAAQRGTVQHEIFEGDQAVAFVDGANIHVKVNCREDAGKLTDRVPYCVAVTLETATELNVPVYDEVRVRLRVPVPVRAG